VLQIDPGGRVVTSTRVGRRACRVAVGSSAIWVARDRAGEVVRVARPSGRLTRVQVGSGAFGVVLAGGFAWASSYDVGTVARIDVRTARVLSVSGDGPNPAGLTFCGGRLWVGHGRDATWLSAIDPATMRVERVDVRATTPSSPRCVRGELWVTTTDTVLRLDPGTGRVLARIRVGGTPADIASGPDGLVWVTDKERSLVFRLDPAGNRVVDSFAAGPGAFAHARAGPAMWVTSFAGADVRAFTP
jgi:DNA-binding beta-propeller fold protein YncE